MTSLVANSANKQLADFGSLHKGSHRGKVTKKDEFDDNRSEASYVSYAQSSSNFSSVMNDPHNSRLHNALNKVDISSSSMAPSQISYEDGFPNAEYNALNEEERARRRKDDKDEKMREFMTKTKKNA